MAIKVPAPLRTLLSLRRPHGGTGEAIAQALVEQCLKEYGYNGCRDAHGNIEVIVGARSDIMFTAHLDTVHKADGPQKIFLIDDSYEIVADGPDGKPSVLGADDAAGVYVLLEMIKAGKPGRYLFFVGEECGGIGSSAWVRDHGDLSAVMVVSFDRKDVDSVITHQAGYQTCSDVFANALSTALNLQNKTFKYEPDDTGMYTDSKEFAHLVPECTNISVGYYHEHTTKECLDLKHLLALAEACVALDWTTLPIDRVPEADVPWWPTGYGKVDKNWNTRTEAIEACEQIRAAVASGEVTAYEINYYLNIIEGYLL